MFNDPSGMDPSDGNHPPAPSPMDPYTGQLTNNFTSTAQWSPATAYGYTDYNGNFHPTVNEGPSGDPSMDQSYRASQAGASYQKQIAKQNITYDLWTYELGTKDKDGNVTDIESIVYFWSPSQPQGGPGADLIKQYNENEENGWALTFAGEALMENGIGGDYLKMIRKSTEAIVIPGDKGLKKGNKIMDAATGFVKTALIITKQSDKILVVTQKSKTAQIYLSAIGLGMMVKGALLLRENDNTIGPKIKK